MESINVINALAALAQETRLAIFRLLVEHGPEGLAAGRIAERLDLAPATLSFHVKELARAGLLNARQDGRFIYYRANFAVMNALIGYLTDKCCTAGPDCHPAFTPAAKATAVGLADRNTSTKPTIHPKWRFV
ncbi:MAG TPA: metalloregulator ArsR/SmtB family transcription factor [Casimicrobiaceae bacterium]|nr:metalloregulator ArsR/SmtB family transcription factor [Casimicrobiaceae bacterium]